MKEKIKTVWSKMEKFSFAQMCSNSDGKTSGSGTMGVLTVSVGLIAFLMGAVDFIISDKADIMTQSLAVVGMGVGLLGYRKSKDGDAPADEVTVDETPSEQLNS
jgi:hypothetical protein